MSGNQIQATKMQMIGKLGQSYVLLMANILPSHGHDMAII